MKDSLSMLALKYNVSQQLIRNENQLLTDNIFSRQELLIPVVPGMTIRVEAKESDESKKKREELRRQTALKMLSDHICEVNKCSKSIDFSA